MHYVCCKCFSKPIKRNELINKQEWKFQCHYRQTWNRDVLNKHTENIYSVWNKKGTC